MRPAARLLSTILAFAVGGCASQDAVPDPGAAPIDDGKADSASGSGGSGSFEAGQISTLLQLGTSTLPFLFSKPGLDAPYESVPGANGWESGASSLSTGNSLRFLVDGDEYERTLLERIGAAQSSIWINVFEWQDEATAREIADALTAAAGRGVDVRVVVDNRHASGDFKSSPVPRHPLLRQMQDAGCEVRAVTYSGYRVNHRKIMIFDGASAIVTGGNFGGNYFLPLSAGWTYHDAGVLLSGPAVGDVVDVFDDSYRRAGGGYLPKGDAPAAEDGDFSDAEVQVLRHDGGADRNIERELVQRIDAAGWRVVLVNGFGMSHDVRDAVIRAAGRGVSVTWLWGSASNDTALMAQASFSDLRDAGVDIRRYGHPLHMKAYVADDTLIIGSSNLDGFSCWLNDEVALQIHSGAAVDAFYDRVVGPDLAASPVLTGDARTGSGWRDWTVQHVLEPIID
jgi:cardiolipin synthase A/B